MDKYFPRIELPIGIDDFHTLPMNSAYKYEYWDGRAVLSARPKTYNVVLDLNDAPLPGETQVERLRRDRLPPLEDLFLHSFHRVQPIASLSEEKGREAVREWLRKIADDEYGPFIESASFEAKWRRDPEQVAGAILITLAPPAQLTDPFGADWEEKPPADTIEKRLGVPHITWMFVSPWEARHGIGTTLLAHAAKALKGMGYTHLASTFLLGNDSSTLWHWKNGFKLLPWSLLFEQRLKEKEEAKSVEPNNSITNAG